MYNIDIYGGGSLMLFVKKLNLVVISLLLFFLSGCAATNALGERLLKAKIVSEENKGALAVCTRANALMYGGGNIAVVKTTKEFKGSVEVKKGCEVVIKTQKPNNGTTQKPNNGTTQKANNPAKELLDTMFNAPEKLVTE